MKTKSSIILFLFIMILSMSGCNTAKPAKPSPTAAPAKETMAAETLATGDSTELEGFIQEESTMNVFVIRTREGEVYSFTKTDDTVIEAEDGIIMGNPVTITYSGTINSTDTSNATLLKVVDKVSPNKEVFSLEGVIETIGMSAVTIKTEDGSSESFLKENTEVLMKESLTEGLSVNIIYTQENSEKSALIIEAAE